ncbi:HAD-IA family hydrolase [uncultured Merdimonas sp.]|uniref:HAD family hydrolase n=1 Tax=uncultured Merdimonas sp. TaxID=2023269 RepID=UPI00320B586F
MKACIFDLDGTLTDTLDSMVYSVNATMEELGLPGITKEQCRRYVGNGARMLMERTLEAVGEKSGQRLEEALAVYLRIFDENCTYHVVPYPGITALLDELKKEDVRLAVLSNKPHEQAVKVVEDIFGKGVFDYVSGQQKNIRRKPDPAGIRHICETLSVPEEDCLYVGDSEVDIKTGENAGVKTVIVSWGFRTGEELRQAGAGIVIDSPAELSAYVR